jgi:aspartate ammonia-lyase
LAGLPLTRSENLSDTTSNLDAYVEIHAILKSHAVNLEKIVSDIRLMSSDLIGEKVFSIPQKQIGSSIMPAKVNPVIPEFIISASHRIYSNDMLLSSLCAQGCLDLNAYLPMIGHALIESLKLMIAMNRTITKNLLEGIEINKERSMKKLLFSPAITTSLIPYIGYKQASELAKLMKKENLDIYNANKRIQSIEELKLKKILKPENLLKLGFSINDLEDQK